MTPPRPLILNVNDGQVPRYVATQMLQRGQFEVLEAANGLDAVSLARQHRPQLVMLDIKLPDIDGYEVCRRLKADPDTVSIPVLLTSATFTTANRKVEGFESGADSYLAQPFEASELIATVRALIRMRAAEAEAQVAVRVRDEFLQVAAHELKTPLTPILLKLLALEHKMQPGKTFPTEDEIRDAIRLSVRQVRRLSTLVEGLLDVSRISAGKLLLDLESVELNELTREVVSRFKEQSLRAGSSLSLQQTAPLVGQWDRVRLEQVLTNLLSNAVKYGAGSNIEVQLSFSGEGVARLEVRDHGIGIASETIERIFNRFERGVSNRSYGGLGLGLFITRQIVEALGGTISVTSDPERGTVFAVLLPLQTAEPERLPESPDAAPRAQG